MLWGWGNPRLQTLSFKDNDRCRFKQQTCLHGQNCEPYHEKSPPALAATVANHGTLLRARLGLGAFLLETHQPAWVFPASCIRLPTPRFRVSNCRERERRVRFTSIEQHWQISVSGQSFPTRWPYRTDIYPFPRHTSSAVLFSRTTLLQKSLK